MSRLMMISIHDCPFCGETLPAQSYAHGELVTHTTCGWSGYYDGERWIKLRRAPWWQRLLWWWWFKNDDMEEWPGERPASAVL